MEPGYGSRKAVAVLVAALAVLGRLPTVQSSSGSASLDFSKDGLRSNGWSVYCDGSKPSPPQLNRPVPSLGDVKLMGPTGDMLYFHHIMKTGGTSLVDAVSRSFPDLVLPGSRRSGFHDMSTFESSYRNFIESPGKTAHDFYMKPWYASSHTNAGALRGATRRKHPGFFDQYKEPGYALPPGSPIPDSDERFLHHMTVVRHPIYLAASRYAEQQCGFKSGKLYDENCGFDMAAFGEQTLQRELQRCRERGHGRSAECRSRAEAKAKKCGSSDEFVANGPAGGIIAGGMKFAHVCPPGTDDPDADDKEAYTTCYRKMVKHLRTYLLPGVTERMHETTCLFHYYTKLPHVKTVGNARHKKCRPISVWTDEAKERAQNMSRAGWALYDAANQVLDERMAAATAHLRSLAFAGVNVASMDFILPGCFDFVSDFGHEQL